MGRVLPKAVYTYMHIAKACRLLLRYCIHNTYICKYDVQLYMDSTAVSIFVVLLVELTNTNIFVNSTNVSTNIETAVLSLAVQEKIFTIKSTVIKCK